MLWRTTPLPSKEMKWVVWRKCFGSHFSLGHCCRMVFVEWFSSEIQHSKNVLLLVFQLSEKKERVNKFAYELLILLNRRETNKGLSSVRINKAAPKIALQPVRRLNAAEFFTVNKWNSLRNPEVQALFPHVTHFARIEMFGNRPIREIWPNLLQVSSWAWVRHALQDVEGFGAIRMMSHSMYKCEQVSHTPANTDMQRSCERFSFTILLC